MGTVGPLPSSPSAKQPVIFCDAPIIVDGCSFETPAGIALGRFFLLPHRRQQFAEH
jgi:hypothetical protein